jgi:hypothetical protein
MGGVWSTKNSTTSRTSGMMQSLRQPGFSCPGLCCMVKWCGHPFRTLFKNPQ